MKENTLNIGNHMGMGKEPAHQVALKAEMEKVFLHGTKMHLYQTALPP